MKYCRFLQQEQPKYGLVEPLAGTDHITRVFTSGPENWDADPESVPTRKVEPIPITVAALLPPVTPSKIICVGRNYREHAAELNNPVPLEPLLFLKPASSLLAPGGTILRPKVSERTDYEGEFGVVIGKRCHNLTDDTDPRPFILGYTCVNDFTARDLQNKDGQWTRAKGFDTFCPAGPVVADGLDPWLGVQVETRVNGEVRQSGNTRDFIFPLDIVLRYISRVMTLEPGDLIATGTPKGVGPVVAGDVVEISIAEIGVLKNAVADAT